MAAEFRKGNHENRHETKKQLPERDRTESENHQFLYEKDVSPEQPQGQQKGFRMNETNETSVIRSLTGLNGITIEHLEQKMRPGASSEDGFLGKNESLKEVLAEDNDTVLEMGITHQQLADFLNNFERAEGEMFGSLPCYGIVEVNGTRYAHAAEQWRGSQTSPFGESSTSKDHKIVNVENGAGITYSGLLPDMIHKYGFYEGKGTPYRLDPKCIAEVAGFISFPPDDPVTQLAQDSNAAVEITTGEQMERMINLDSVTGDILESQQYRIVPEDLSSLLKFCELFGRQHDERYREEPEYQRNRREQITGHVAINDIRPQSYNIESINRMRILTETIPSDFPQFEETVLQRLEPLELPRRDNGEIDTFIVARFLEKTLKGAYEKSEGQDNPHKTYYEGLLRRFPQDQDATRQLYEAALGSGLPKQKRDLLALYKQLGLHENDNIRLEE